MRKGQHFKLLISVYFTIFALLVIFSNSIIAQEQFVISGKVLSAETGLPVEASICIFSTKSNYSKDFVAMDKTVPDKEGNYQITLQKGLNYKVAAFPWTNDFSSMFYDNSETLENAKIIYLDKSYDNIDFKFTQKPTYKNSIFGYVLNTKNEFVSATVYLRPINSIYSDQYSSSTDKTNSQSFSFTNIRPGEYILYAVPNVNNLSDGYYLANGVAVNDPSLATIIKIGENDKNTEKYVITLADKKAESATYIVKGMVYDENKSPISNVEITVYNEKGIPDAMQVLTDINGVFIFKITGSGKYYIKASKEGYSEGSSPLFLDKNNSEIAVYIQLIKIDNKVYENGVKGVVVNTKGEVVFSKVMLMKVVSDNTVNEIIVITNSESTGEFIFENLKPGKYYLYASPAIAGLASGYYKENDVAVTGMKGATIIEVMEKGMNQDNYVIILPEQEVKNQYPELYGIVTDDSNNPLTEVKFTVFDENGNEVKFKSDPNADKDGYFHLYFAKMGTFVIHANKEGYNEVVEKLTFNNSNPVQKILIVMSLNDGQVKGGDDTKEGASGLTDKNEFNIFQVYPNPATSNLNINMKEITGNIIFHVYDTQGNDVASYQFNVNNSNSILNLNISNLQTGSYILKGYKGNTEVFTQKYIKY